MASSRPKSIVWIKEEGLGTPPPLAILSERGWSAHVLGFGYDRLRRFRIGRWVRLSVSVGHVIGVALGWRRATLVVGTHYAGLCAALVRSVWPLARFAVVVHSVYAIPESRDRGILKWIVRTGLRKCDAVIVNSAEIGRRILAEHLVASPNSVFLLPDGAPTVASATNRRAKYAFSGGSSARDWDGLGAVVRATSGEVNWIIACPASVGRVLGVTLVRAAQVAGAVVIACGLPYLSEYIESGVDGVLARDVEDAVRWVLRAWRNETIARGLEQGARGRCELDRLRWREANIRLADFLEWIDESRGSTESRTM